MKTTFVAVSVLTALAVAGVFLILSRFSLSAIPEPGRTETFLATKAKDIYVRWGSRERIPPAPVELEASVAEGDKLFGTECANCHGLDGHEPTDAGRWMNPRAANLISGEVQHFSDRELFWIVKNGIRFSGMPAFGKVETDEHIWNLAHYLRTLNPGK